MLFRAHYFLSVGFLFVHAFAHAKSYGLQDVHKKALSHVYQTQIQKLQVESSQEQLDQAYGSILPSVSLRADHSRIDPISGIPGFDVEASQAAVNISQPLLRGLREYSALSIAQERLEQEMITRDVVKREILFQVAQAFYSLLIQDKELSNTKRQIELTQERVEDLEKRVEIGRSRKAELLLAESQLANTRSQLQGVERERSRWVTELERLTGLKVQNISLEPLSKKKLELRSLQNYLSKIDGLPEIQQAQQRIAVSDSEIELQKRYHLPDLTLDGNVYLARTGFREDSVWDMSVNLVFPLYEGGQVSSRVKQATIVKNQESLRLRELKRNLSSEIKELYSFVQLDLERLQVTKRAVDLSRENYEEQRKEYNLGLVTNLEVLQSLDAYIESQKRYDRLILEAGYNLSVLKAKVGVL